MYRNIFIIYKMDNRFKKDFIQIKKERRFDYYIYLRKKSI